jgi:hypothetical protein
MYMRVRARVYVCVCVRVCIWVWGHLYCHECAATLHCLLSARFSYGVVARLGMLWTELENEGLLARMASGGSLCLAIGRPDA